ncbi:MAG: hypothetical protein JXR78_18745 [Victivallales bacterium]|nr:hypothetical protein [Victivallales bacterium]
MSTMNANSDTLNFQGVSDQLKRIIGDLTDSSVRLQSAVVARDVEAVWQIIGEQQESMALFDKYNYLWKQIVVDTGIQSPQITQIKSELNENLEHLKQTGSKNAVLIRSFLAAINKAFKRTVGLGAKSKVYSKKGKMSYKQASMLINRLG